MSETTVDLNNKSNKMRTVSVKNQHGDTYFMTINGETDEDVQRQFNLITDHDTAHLIADNMTSQWAAENSVASNDSEAQDKINRIMDEPSGGVASTSHAINLESDGNVVARATIKAPDQLKAVRVLMVLAHQGPTQRPTPPNKGTFGQDLNDSLDERLQQNGKKPFDPTDPSSVSF